MVSPRESTPESNTQTIKSGKVTKPERVVEVKENTSPNETKPSLRLKISPKAWAQAERKEEKKKRRR
ncbi:unnamed protein product [Bursaphelenchus okinawaensis]|uniref:Uncharacterized protein n=1 Tax=Bursaphelenchus okinawaensis TaxID=465554 RepID=A0A811JRV1_9BILA|nr:unnamed protein product [Bursaphelenchus okinawaensis]CAG9079615.1 unnamed protein product [Bursaphelenchus okinawaensis]